MRDSSEEHPFTIFVEDRQGPLFNEFCADIAEARRKAQELADREGFPCLIFNFDKSRQVGQFRPKPKVTSSDYAPH
jgi:hypothetical protein